MRSQQKISQTKHEVLIWDHITLELTYISRVMWYIRKRRHINFFLKINIQKGILNIKLWDVSLTNWNYSNKSMNNSYFCNRGKYLLIIHTILLRVSFYNQPSFVSLKRSIRISLDLIYPMATNNTLTRR